jgi:hypothetical protein
VAGARAVVSLTQEAERRLGIEIGEVTFAPLPRARSFVGELTLALVRGGAGSPRPRLSADSLAPATSAFELTHIAQLQAQADGVLEAAKISLDSARNARARAESMLRIKAGSERALEEARVQERLAEAALRNARAQRELWGVPVLDALAQGALWLRVPVSVDALAELDLEAPAGVRGLGDPPAAAARVARLVATPWVDAPVRGMVDLYYEVENADRSLRLGQQLSVALPLRGAAETLSVPWSAVIYDLHGTSWVYQRVAPGSFSRRRVQIGDLVEGRAALATGPEPGAHVVTAGVAELLGTELGLAD